MSKSFRRIPVYMLVSVILSGILVACCKWVPAPLAINGISTAIPDSSTSDSYTYHLLYGTKDISHELIFLDGGYWTAASFMDAVRAGTHGTRDTGIGDAWIANIGKSKSNYLWKTVISEKGKKEGVLQFTSSADKAPHFPCLVQGENCTVGTARYLGQVTSYMWEISKSDKATTQKLTLNYKVY